MSAEVMFNRETHKSRGFGFIIFESEDSVDLVCDEKEHSIDGKVVCACSKGFTMTSIYLRYLYYCM